MSEPRFRIWCLRDRQTTPFSVFVPINGDVDHLTTELLKRFHVSVIVLRKLKNPFPIAPFATLSERLKVASLTTDALDDPLCKLQDTFPEDLVEGHIHMIVELAGTSAPINRNRLCAGRSWHVNAAIFGPMTSQYYFLDPAVQAQSNIIVDRATRGEFILLTGPRASGKSTRLYRLRELLEEKGYHCLHFSFELVDYSKDTDVFWSSIGVLLAHDFTAPFSVKISSPITFHDAFAKNKWDRQVVILIDELSEIWEAAPKIKDSFLCTMRGIRHGKPNSAIASVIAAGTPSLMGLTTINPYLSPYNIWSVVQTPFFTIHETRQLFEMFQQDYNITLESAIVDDIWEKSKGHPGMVCLCGRIVFDNLRSLQDGGRTISLDNWLRFPTRKLFEEILAYPTFFSMIDSLRDKRAQKAVQLYRTQFAGFLGDVDLTEPDEVLADFLTSEGVLSRPVAAESKYHVISPLIDAFVRLRVIPNQFPIAPLVPVSVILDIPFILTESLKCFDKALIRSAYSRSFKSSKVPVNDSSHTQVPRESVYDTELMRILCNWLGTFGWFVNGQWHLETPDGRPKYSDIVLQKGNKTIVLKVLATVDAESINAHIKKTPEYMGLLSADEGWVIHFTCEDGFTPTWQTPDELDRGVNVIHVSHREDFENVTLHINSKHVDKQSQDLCLS